MKLYSKRIHQVLTLNLKTRHNFAMLTTCEWFYCSSTSAAVVEHFFATIYTYIYAKSFTNYHLNADSDEQFHQIKL